MKYALKGVLRESHSCGIWAINEIDSVLVIYASNPTKAQHPFTWFGCIYSKNWCYALVL